MKRITLFTLTLAALLAAGTAGASNWGKGKDINQSCKPTSFCGGATGLDLIVVEADCDVQVYKNHASCDEGPPDIDVPHH